MTDKLDHQRLPSLQDLRTRGILNEHKNNKVNVYEVARWIRHDRRYTFVTIKELISSRNNSQGIHIYEKGVYKSEGGVVIEEETQALLGTHNKCTNQIVREVIGQIKRHHIISLREFDQDPYRINVANDWIDVRTLEFDHHSPDDFSLVQLPVAYDPEAVCPQFRQVLKDWVGPERVPLMEEIFGYCLIKKMPFHKLFIFVGDGFNGKDTCLATLRALLGDKNCSNVGLKDLCGDRFASANLHGKLANIATELSPRYIKDTERIKALTGESVIDAPIKHVQKPISFESYATPIFACNTMPDFDDDTDAFHERLVVIPFIGQWLSSDPRQIPELKDKLMDELSGILNLALQGLQRLLTNKRFSEPVMTADEKRSLHKKLADSVVAFMDEEMEQTSSTEDKLYLQDAWLIFQTWMQKKGYIRIGRNRFYDKLRKAVVQNPKKDTKVGKDYINGWKLLYPPSELEECPKNGKQGTL
ncbi:MAG: phage/plasmid primase, P4 family [Candidatus Heimdallarchaeota archaeon]